VLDKALVWLGSTRADLRRFSAAVRRIAGFQFRRVQQGLDPNDWKPMSSVTQRNDVRVTESSGNVFRDLGFPRDEAEHLLVRADLLIQLQKALKARGLTQSKAAKLLGVTQPRVSDLLRGRIDLFSTDTLIDMLARVGIGVRVVLKPLRPRSAA
jgi:predicted XRE-type DNA-binding protein